MRVEKHTSSGRSLVGSLAVSGLMATCAMGAWSAVPTQAAQRSAQQEVTPAAAATSQAAGCAPLLFVGLRGSGETERDGDGFGRDVNAVRLSMLDILGRSTFQAAPDGDTGFAVWYPSEKVSVLAPTARQAAGMVSRNPVRVANAVAGWKLTRYNRFKDSIEIGTDSAYTTLTEHAEACPDQQIVLVGYSQGAMAVHRVLQRLKRDGEDTILDHVRGVGLIADGDRVRFTHGVQLGSVSADARGVAAFARDQRADLPTRLAPVTVSLCDAQDVVCDFTLKNLVHIVRGTRIHTTYDGPRLTDLGEHLAALVDLPLTGDKVLDAVDDRGDVRVTVEKPFMTVDQRRSVDINRVTVRHIEAAGVYRFTVNTARITKSTRFSQAFALSLRPAGTYSRRWQAWVGFSPQHPGLAYAGLGYDDGAGGDRSCELTSQSSGGNVWVDVPSDCLPPAAARVDVGSSTGCFRCDGDPYTEDSLRVRGRYVLGSTPVG